MTWSVPTYHHTNAMDDDADPAWRVALFELMRAVNERQLALGATAFTQFYKGDGTQGYDLALTDLAGLGLTSLNTRTNLTRIRDWIIANLGRFTTTNGGTAVWTKATMETDIGTDLDASPVIPLDSRYWQAMQDALDRMVYAYSELTPYGTAYNGYGSNPGVSASTAQDAWDDRTNYASGPPQFNYGPAGWIIGSGSRATIFESIDINFRFGVSTSAATLLGTGIDSFYEYTADFDHVTIGSIDFDIDGDTITISGGGSGTAPATFTSGVELSRVLSVDTAEPSTVPFSGMSAPSPGRIRLYITRLKIYHDLASILTDQA